MFEQLDLSEFEKEANEMDNESKPLVTMEVLSEFIEEVVSVHSVLIWY